MDAKQFDRMATRLHGAQNRRGVLAGLGALGMGLVPAALRPVETAAKKKKPRKCKPACGACEKCKKNGTCQTLADFKACTTSSGADGACFGGVCGVPISCSGFSLPCVPNVPSTCCSGVCTSAGPIGFCAIGAPGSHCLANSDCSSGKCSGFVCSS